LTELVENDLARSEIQNALAQWHQPAAAAQIAESILSAIAQQEKEAQLKVKKCNCGHAHRPAKHAH
jgi:hypothetical protein